MSTEDGYEFDAAVLRAIGSRDEQSRNKAWRQLLERYGDLVYGIARAHVESDSAAEEACVNAWSSLATALEKGDRSASVSPEMLRRYIFVTAANAARDVQRALRRRLTSEVSEEMESTMKADGDLLDSERATIRSDAWDDVRGCLNNADRLLLDMLLDEQQPAVIQLSLGLTPAAYHKRVSRLRERLRIAIESLDLMTRLLNGEEPL
jgi:RNA polymerase sigma factor (sigma-70 family)